MVTVQNEQMTIQPQQTGIQFGFNSLDMAIIDLRVNYLGSAQVLTKPGSKNRAAAFCLKIVGIPSEWSKSKKTIVHEINYYNMNEVQFDYQQVVAVIQQQKKIQNKPSGY